MAANQCNLQGAGAPIAANACANSGLSHTEPLRSVRFMTTPNDCQCTCSCPQKPGTRAGIATDMNFSEICPSCGGKR